MPDSIGFLLFVVAVLALALLAAYLHSRRCGWRPMPVDGVDCDFCGQLLERGEPVVVNSEGCWEHPYDCLREPH